MASGRSIAVRVSIFVPLLATVLWGAFAGEGFVVDQVPQAADVIIVLGAPARPNGEPSQVMRLRVEQGVALYAAGYAPRIIMSGASVGNTFAEAQVMAAYAQSLGVPRSSIIIEDGSTDTVENAALSVAIMHASGWSSALVVTSPYHTGRALLLFRREGVRATTVAAGDIAQLSPRERLQAIYHELGAYVYSFIKLSLRLSSLG